MSDKRKKTNTNTITQIALVSALLCIISPFAVAVPVSPVPVSLATLMLYISVYILETRDAVISCGIYLLIGLVGIPVFSGFTGGIGKVLGPTGGYMIGYLFLTGISGWFVKKGSAGNRKKVQNDNRKGNRGKKDSHYFMQALGMILGTSVCYFFGSVWLAYQIDVDFFTAVGIGSVPFIPSDALKIFCAILIGNAMRRRLLKTGMM